ncbi:CaiB/BaiF CoA transferase family protein [Rhodococcus erythropolis]|uniref:CaiB/BaiF CoA transferase family protein n=1 Tax=Rhodococcus erythropolis TaxID=1833 RepID=UPI0024B7ABFC|nr:CoA transferase [Rhodococcus erythropolis]MDJ0012761.1 CoA transferase [Rhodococcus erythropolis]
MSGLPLEGLRVLDLSTILAAPMISSLLGEFGATVIKIENPVGGDPVRNYPPLRGGESAMWTQYGRNKSSVGIDLHDSQGVELVKGLVRETDVVVTNFRPSTLRRFGLDYEDLIAVNDRLILLHLTAYGRTGPYSDRPGFARVLEAFAGLTHRTGNPDGPPMFSGYPIADGVAGMYGAFAVMLAIRQRDLTGESQLIDLALYEPLLRMMEDFIPAYGATGASATRVGNNNPSIAPNGLFRTADDQWIVLPASTNQMWNRLLKFIDREDLSHLDTMAARIANRDVVDGAVEQYISAHTQAELLHGLHAAGIAAGPVNTANDIVSDEHIIARGSILEAQDRHGNDTLLVSSAGRFSGFGPSTSVREPGLGEHTDEILSKALGLDNSQLNRLRADGVIS